MIDPNECPFPCDELIISTPEVEGLGAGIEYRSWEISASATLTYTGSIDILDPCGLRACCPTEYTADPEFPTEFVWAINNAAINVCLETTGGAYIDPVYDEECLFGTHCWVKGVLTSTESSWELDSYTLTAPIQSVFVPLYKKSLITDHSYNVLRDPAYGTTNSTLIGLDETITIFSPMPPRADEVLTEIVTKYIPVPVDSYDFSETSSEPVVGPVSGNDSIAEMGLVALVGKSNLFIDEQGRLKTGQWKDLQYVIDNDVDVDVPETVVLSASKTESPLVNPTELKIQGMFRSSDEFGYRPFGLFPTNTADTSQGGGGGFGSFCITNHLASPEHGFGLRNLIGQPDDWRNGVFTVRDRNTNTVHSVSGADFATNDAFLKFLKQNDLEWVNSGVFDIEAHVPVRSRNERTQLTSGVSVHAALVRSALSPYISFLQNPRGFNPFLHSMPLALAAAVRSGAAFDTNNPNRREMVLRDPCYYGKVGPAQETLDNRYLFAPEQLFDFGVRRFQEIRMSTRTWTFELAYYPCLHVNDAVRVRTPLIDNASCEVVGIVTEIRTKWESTPKATTTITVADLCGLNECEIQSPNLLFDPTMQGMGAFWQALRTQGPDTFLPVPVATVSHGAARGIIFDDGSISFVLLHPYITPGRTYEFKFTIGQLTGSPFVFGIWKGPGGFSTGAGVFGNTVGSWTHALTAPVGADSLIVLWNLNSNGSMIFNNVSLTTTAFI